MPNVFTAAERNLIRSEFGEHFGRRRQLREGILLPRWTTGPKAGKPRITSVLQGMLARGLVEIADPEHGWPTARFTVAGLEALWTMATNKKYLPPERYGHLIADLREVTG